MQYPMEVKIQSDFEQVGTQTQWLLVLFAVRWCLIAVGANDRLCAVCVLSFTLTKNKMSSTSGTH